MIEIGEYARMKSGEILKIAGTAYEIDDYKIYKTDRNYTIVEDEIKSHSKNIIDVIEPSDLVNGLIVKSVHHFPDGKNSSLIWVGSEFYIEDNIRTILTHEQYEQDCYRLEE